MCIKKEKGKSGAMEKQKSILVPLIIKLANLESDYIKSLSTRKELEEDIHRLKLHYEFMIPSFSKRDIYCSAILLLFLERIKISIELEDKIVETVSFESLFFDENIHKITKNMDKLSKSNAFYATKEDVSLHYSRLKSRRTNYPKHVSQILRKWLQDHVKNPYPSDSEKVILREKTGLDATQINNWFINARRRILPFLRESYKSRQH